MELNQQTEEAAAEHIDRLVEHVAAKTSVVLATEDGMEMLARGHDEQLVSRMAAMSSSMTALGVMAGEECNLGGFKTITLELDEGFMLMFQIERSEKNLILGIVADHSATIGQVLHHGKRTAERLATA